MHIQIVEPKDTEALDALMCRVIATSVALGKTEMAEVIANVQQNLRWAQQYPHAAVHVKCVSDGAIVGVALIKNFWNLCSLFVEVDFQRQGIGRALLNESIQRCVSLNDRGHIKVNAALDAVPFYRSLGFAAGDEPHPKGTSLPMLLRLSSRSD